MAQRLLTPRNSLRGFRKPVRPVLDTTHPLSRGLVGCWLLGDNPGRATDVSVNQNNGSYVASPATAFSHHGGMATQFNGSTQIVNIPHSAAISLGGSFTVGCWARVTGGTGSFRSVVSKHLVGGGDVRNYDLAARAGNVWGTYCTQGASNYKGFDGSIPIVTNAWMHVVTTYDGTTLRLFVDGIADGTLSVSGAMDTVTDPLVIGAIDAGLGEAFTGGVEGVRIYNRALSVSEILAWKAEPYAGLYSAGSAYRVGVIAGGDVTLALTGLGATASPGSLSTASLITKALTGISATAGVGTVTPGLSKPLSGNAGTASVGSLGTGSLITIGLSGIGSTASAGTVSTSGDKTLAITGSAASAFAGSIGIGLSKAISGNAATASPGSVSKTSLITIALTGNQATSGIGTIVATGGSSAIWNPVPVVATPWTPATDDSQIWTPVVPANPTWTPQ